MKSVNHPQMREDVPPPSPSSPSPAPVRIVTRQHQHDPYRQNPPPYRSTGVPDDAPAEYFWPSEDTPPPTPVAMVAPTPLLPSDPVPAPYRSAPSLAVVPRKQSLPTPEPKHDAVSVSLKTLPVRSEKVSARRPLLISHVDNIAAVPVVEVAPPVPPPAAPPVVPAAPQQTVQQPTYSTTGPPVVHAAPPPVKKKNQWK